MNDIFGRSTCFWHPAVVARNRCQKCQKLLCSSCAHEVSGATRCFDCLKAGSHRLPFVVGLCSLLGLVGVAFGVLSYRQNVDISEDVAAHGISPSEKFAPLIAQQEREPCDRRKALELTSALFREGEARAAIQRAETFIKTCGEFDRLRWVAFEAHKQLSEFELASGEVTRLIELAPTNPDAWGWRGLLRQDRGQLAQAASDFNQALTLNPRLGDIPFNLADALERQSQPCAAIAPLAQVLFYYPSVRNAPEIQHRIDRLARSSNCSEVEGSGNARFTRQPGTGVTLVPVKINNSVSGQFIVDTGATLVAVTQQFADRLGLDAASAPALHVQTANGASKAFGVTLASVVVKGLRAKQVPAAIIQELAGADGLLGMSFLTRFELKQTATALELTQRATR